MAKTLMFTEEFVVENQLTPENKESVKHVLFQESDGNRAYLIPKIEAIHAGITKNKVEYTAQALAGSVDLRSGVFSWTHPYPKPVLKNHDRDTEPLGRVMNAQFTSDSTTGKSAIVVTPQITDQDAIQKILDGRYLTVSIGAETDSATCSICGTDIIQEGWCEHDRGMMYEVDGKEVECYWIAGNLWFHEVSFVNVPADQHAQVVASGELQFMECFASDGKEIYDLQVCPSSDKFCITQEAAERGIKINDENRIVLDGAGKASPPARKKSSNKKSEGGTGVKTLEQLESQVADLETKLQTAEDEKTNLSNQLTEKDTTISQLNEEKVQLTDQVASLTAEKEQLQSDVTALTEKSQESEGRLNEFEEENKRLLDENTNMATEIHRALTERVVDLKCALDKPGSDKRDEMLNDHIERSDESLKDSLADLLKELENAPRGTYIPNKIPNPGLSDKDKQPGVITEGKKEDEHGKQVTVQDVFYGLLTKTNRR